MTSSKQTERGFGVVEILMVAAAVVVLGAIGFVVYRHQHNNRVANATSSTTQTIPKQTTSANTQPAQTTTQYVVIKEWGVEAPYSGNLNLSYAMSSDSTAAVFSSSQLSALSNDCVGRGGAIKRWASTDKVSVYPSDPSAPTATTYFASAAPSTYGHIGNYYYTYQSDQAACGDGGTTSTLHAQTNADVKALVPKLQAVSQ